MKSPKLTKTINAEKSLKPFWVGIDFFFFNFIGLREGQRLTLFLYSLFIDTQVKESQDDLE